MATEIDKQKDIIEARKTSSLSDSSPFLEVYIIGGCGGGSFTFYGGTDGSMLEKIGVWLCGWTITAVKVWRTNGQSETFGKTSGGYKEYKFQKGELIKSMSLWGNGTGTKLGAIQFETDKGGSFFAKMTDCCLKQEHPIDVGSGVCVGVMGRAGSGIDSMGFVFVKPLQCSIMTDVHYPTIGFAEANVQMNNLKSVEYDNNLDVDQNFTVEDSTTVTTTESWQRTAGMEFTIGGTIKAGIPELVEVGAGWSFKVSVSGTYKIENSESKTETWKFPVTVPPQTKVLVTISMGKADVDLPYSAKIKMTTTDGSDLIFDVNGVYNAVTFTKAFINIQKV